MAFDDAKHPRDRRKGVRTAGQFVTSPKGETDVALGVAQDDPRLLDALARYGLTLDDVPPDHEGITLAQRWAQTVALAEAPDVESVTEVLSRELGEVNYGRHRGGPDPVWAKNGQPHFDDEEWADSADDPADPRWDDPQWSIAASVHTRNGGGNRDCYCFRVDDEHDEGCLVPVIAALQEHPAYLCDEDDDGDRTYANFYFRIDDKGAVRAALSRRRDHNEQARARALLRAVAAEPTQDRWVDRPKPPTAPWEVMPRNPDTNEAATAAAQRLEQTRDGVLNERDARALGADVDYGHGFYGRGRVTVRFGAEQAADVRAALAWADDPTQPFPELRGKWRRIGKGAMGDLVFAAEQLAARRDGARRSVAVRCALDAGGLDPDVERVLRDVLQSSLGLKGKEDDYARALESVHAAVERVRALEPAVAQAELLLATRAADEEVTRLPESARRWPGGWEETPQLQR